METIGRSMKTIEVKSLVRDVIVYYGLPFTVLSVVDSPRGWDVLVLAQTGGTIPFTVPDGRAVSIREAIQKTLEAEL
jgi:hypothetical protein